MLSNTLMCRRSSSEVRTAVVACCYLPFAEVLWVRPGAVLLLCHWPVAAGVAGPADVLHLPLLLHGLTDASHVASKLRVGAHCAWRGGGEGEEEEEDQRHSEFLTPSAFLFGSPELNPFGQTVYRSRKITKGRESPPHNGPQLHLKESAAR